MARSRGASGNACADRNEIVVNLIKCDGFKLALDMFDLHPPPRKTWSIIGGAAKRP